MVRQSDPRLHRIWFHSLTADLVIDYERADGSLIGFEIDWDHAPWRRHYLRWGRQVGVRTGSVDTGDCPAYRHKRSPIVSWDPGVESDSVDAARRLIAESGIESKLRAEILFCLA